MFLNDSSWHLVADTQGLTSQVRRLLEAEGDPRHQYFALDADDDARLHVTGVRRRDMLCYPGWVLYELTIDLAKLGPRSGYAAGAVYVLIDAAPEALHAASHAVLLNGTSPVIHSLNASSWGKGGGRPLQLSGAAEYLEYLRFFCTFVAGEEGPFLIVEHPEDLLSIVGTVDFEELLVERRRSLGWSDPAVPVPREALEAFLAAPAEQQDEALAALKAAVPRPRDAKHAKLTPLDRLRKVTEQVGEHWSLRPAVGDGTDRRFHAEGLVLYGRHLFRSRFAMDANGMIEMLGDEPIETDLPIRSCRFDPQYPVLLLQDQRREMTGDELARELFDVAGASRGEPVSNRLILGDLNLKGRKIEKRIHLDDVWITGDVILDDLRTPFSIGLSNTWVGGALHAKTLQCDGALTLNRLRVYGYFNPAGPEFKDAPARDRVALSLRGAHVKSELDLTRTDIRGGLDLDDSEIGGSARLTGLRIEYREPLIERSATDGTTQYGLSARRARFMRGVDMAIDQGEGLIKDPRPPRVVGNLEIEGAVVEADIDISRMDVIHSYWGVNAAHLSDQYRQLCSQALAHDALVLGSWNLSSGRAETLSLLQPLKGHANLAGTRIGGSFAARGISASWLSLYRSSVNGDVNVSADYEPEYFGRAAKCTETRLIGWVGMKPTEDCLMLGSATIKGSVMLNGADLHGSLSANGTSIGGFLDGNPNAWLKTRIRGDVSLSGATIGSDTRFCCAEIGGLFKVITGSLKRVQMRAEMMPKNPNDPTASAEPFACEPSRVGGILIQTALIDDIDLYAIQVDGETDEELSGSIDLSAVEVRGSLTFFNMRPDRYLLHGLSDKAERGARSSALPDLCAHSARIGRDFKASALTVKGQIELTNLDVARGEIRLSGAKCEKLTALSVIPSDVVALYEKSGGRCSSRYPRLKAKSLNLDRLHCSGDADLSGLDISGNVTARSAHVDGTLAFYDLKDDSQVASIRGEHDPELPALDLELVRTPTLCISGKTFLVQGQPRAKALKADRADVTELELKGETPHHASLQDLKLAQLTTPSKGYARELLRTSLPFDQGIYRTVERSLRAEGDDARANAIYRQMRWRGLLPRMTPSPNSLSDATRRAALLIGDALPAIVITALAVVALSFAPPLASLTLLALLILGIMLFPPLGGLFRSLFRLGEAVIIGVLTGFWTQGYRFLVLVLLITLPISWLAFSVPENIEPTTAHLGETGKAGQRERARSDWPDPSEWSLDERARLLAATHIPIIPLIDGARWEPAENRGLCLPESVRIEGLAAPIDQSYCPVGTWELAGGLSPAGYGMIVRALHWIAWPLFLIGMSGIIQRTGRQ